MTYLIKPLSYVLIISLGYALKRVGFLKKTDQALLSKIMLNVTLPCAIISGFADVGRDASLFLISVIGLLFGFLPMLLMYWTTRGVNPRLRAYRMLNVAGSNIGCFSLPLVQAFFGSQGVVTACMYDVGNAVMMTGGSYTMTSTLLGVGSEKREGVREILMKFVKSAPFDTYMVLLAMTALNISIPPVVCQLVQPTGNANAFLAMLIIGLMFEPAAEPALLRETVRELAFRYGFAAAAAACCWLLPLDLLARQVLCVLCFAPVSALAPIYTDRCGGDAALSGFTNSVSIAVSLVCMFALSMFFIA
ncbi:MAG: AEC family transporter [Clostridia bacterium]|nr:AEC family transporter [Clostridia bacterium]